MKYGIEQRLRLVDFLLHQYGFINRSALVDYFGISIPQATIDFKLYMKTAPDNMRYVKTEKVYKRNPEFKRYWD